MDVAEVNKLIKQQAQMAKMMKKFANPSGMSKMMRSLGNMQNNLAVVAVWAHSLVTMTKRNKNTK